MATTSTSPSDSESDELVIADNPDYMRDVYQIIGSHQEISIENALVLNKQMRAKLVILKGESERLLEICQQKQKENDVILAEMSKSQKNASTACATYYFCGYPFFKDRNGDSAALPASYVQRRDAGELFPLELETKRYLWTARDKVNLVQGVKKQVMNYLHMKNRDKLRQVATKRCAEDLATRINKDSEMVKKESLAELLKKIEGTDFRINWSNLSIEDLDSRHTDNECIGMWYGYLMPTLNRKNWTSDEEDRLLAAVSKHSAQNWAEIAKEVENRSSYQCFIHYQTAFGGKNVVKHTPWTADEDKMLLESVEKYRIGNVIPWTKISEKMSGRHKRQLYNRYMFTLNPEINRAPFTVEEDCILMAAIKEYGTNYREFPTNLLPGRNMKQIRARYNNALKFVGVREHWNEKNDIKLMELVEKYGTSDWAKVAQELVHHNRTSCRQRYTTIKKFLEKNPTKTVVDVPRRKKAFSSNVTTENWMETIIREKTNDAVMGDEAEFEDAEFVDVNEINPAKEIVPAPQNLLVSTEIGRQYYDYFKYSYNFEFGKQIIGAESLFENVQICAQLLQAPTIPFKMKVEDMGCSDYVTFHIPKKVRLESDLLKSLNEVGKKDFRFPVNYNTVLGLRGLAATFDSNTEDPLEASRIKEEAPPQHPALDLFKKRFMSIFKNTATLAKVPDLIKHEKGSSEPVRVRDTRKRFVHPNVVTTKDFDNNSTLVRVVQPNETIVSSDGNYMITDNTPPRPLRAPVSNDCSTTTVLESVTLGIGPDCAGMQRNFCLPFDPSMPSTSAPILDNNYAYISSIDTSDGIYKINLQQCDSAPDTINYDSQSQSTDFIVWDPTQSEDESESAPKRCKTSN